MDIITSENLRELIPLIKLVNDTNETQIFIDLDQTYEFTIKILEHVICRKQLEYYDCNPEYSNKLKIKDEINKINETQLYLKKCSNGEISYQSLLKIIDNINKEYICQILTYYFGSYGKKIKKINNDKISLKFSYNNKYTKVLINKSRFIEVSTLYNDLIESGYTENELEINLQYTENVLDKILYSIKNNKIIFDLMDYKEIIMYINIIDYLGIAIKK